jgi:hypothetical protein
MFKNLPAWWLVPLLVAPAMLVAQPALPSTAATAAPRQAASPAAPSDVPGYRSAFEGYQPYRDDKMLDWKSANDDVGGFGGWRAYAKEAQQPLQSPQSPQSRPQQTPEGKTPPASPPSAGPAQEGRKP